MVINLHKIVVAEKTYSKYFNKMWLLIKYSLLVVMKRWRHNASWIQACLSQLVLSVVTLLRWGILSGSLMKNFIVSALSNIGAWNQVSCNSKTQPTCKRCVLVHCGAGRCKSQAILTSVWKWSFWALSWLQW